MVHYYELSWYDNTNLTFPFGEIQAYYTGQYFLNYGDIKVFSMNKNK